MSEESFGLIGALGNPAGPDPIVASLGWLVAGVAVGAGGAWAYSGGNASATNIEMTALVIGLVIGGLGAMLSWVARRRYLRQSRQQLVPFCARGC